LIGARRALWTRRRRSRTLGPAPVEALFEIRLAHLPSDGGEQAISAGRG
jgi:hypothetical protein